MELTAWSETEGTSGPSALVAPLFGSPDVFATYLSRELSFLSAEQVSEFGPDTDLVVDLGFDSLSMLELFDVLDSLLGSEAAFDFDMAAIGTTVRSIYLYCLESLHRPLDQEIG